MILYSLSGLNTCSQFWLLKYNLILMSPLQLQPSYIFNAVYILGLALRSKIYEVGCLSRLQVHWWPTRQMRDRQFRPQRLQLKAWSGLVWYSSWGLPVLPPAAFLFKVDHASVLKYIWMFLWAEKNHKLQYSFFFRAWKCWKHSQEVR